MRCWLLVGFLVAAAGCDRGRADASCDAVGHRFLELARHQLEAAKDLDGELKSSISGLLLPMRDSMIRACNEGKWDTEARRCFAAAADDGGLKRCYETLPLAQRTALEKATAAVGK